MVSNIMIRKIRGWFKDMICDHGWHGEFDVLHTNDSCEHTICKWCGYIIIKDMRYEEFVDWCNDRACDGQWGMGVALACISIMDNVRPIWFWWRREQKWKEINKTFQIEKIIESMEETKRNMAV